MTEKPKGNSNNSNDGGRVEAGRKEAGYKGPQNVAKPTSLPKPPPASGDKKK